MIYRVQRARPGKILVHPPGPELYQASCTLCCFRYYPTSNWKHNFHPSNRLATQHDSTCDTARNSQLQTHDTRFSQLVTPRLACLILQPVSADVQFRAVHSREGLITYNNITTIHTQNHSFCFLV